MSIYKPARLSQLDYDGDRWVVRLPHGTKFEDALDENFYAHVAMTLKPWDEIVVRPEDMSYKAVLVVISAGNLWAKVAIERFVELKVGAVKTDLTVQWSGPHTRFRVMSGTDVLKDGFVSKDEAIAWKDDHAKAA